MEGSSTVATDATKQTVLLATVAKKQTVLLATVPLYKRYRGLTGINRCSETNGSFGYRCTNGTGNVGD